MDSLGQNLAPQLNLQQLKENITALQKGGLTNDKVQMYVDNYKKDTSGNYVLKSAPQPSPTPEQQAASTLDNNKVMSAGASLFNNTGKFVGGALLNATNLAAVNTQDYKGATQSSSDLNTLDEHAVVRAHELALAGKTQEAQRLLSVVQSHGKSITMNDILPNSQQNNVKQIAGAGLGTALDLSTFAEGGAAVKAGEKLGVRVLKGAAQGYGYDVSQNLQKDKNGLNILKPGVGTAVGATLPFVTALTGALAKGISGKLSGAGTDVVQRAVKNPDAVGEAISKYAKAPETRQELVAQAEDAVHTFANQKNQEYATKLSGLAFDKPLEIQPTNTFVQSVKKFSGTIDGAGNLTFGDSALTKADKSNLTDAWEAIKNWQDNSPKGLDTLRQNIGNHMKDFKVAGNPRANVVLGEVKTKLTSAMKSSIPGYAEMLSSYGNKAEAAIEFAKEFQLSGNAKDSSKLNNIMRLFKKDPAAMQSLEEIMGKDGANSFQNEVAGAILSHWIKPNSVLSNVVKGSAEALGIGGSLIAGNPLAATTALGTVAASSPRIVGKTATLVGKANQAGVGKVAKKLITKGSAEAN